MKKWAKLFSIIFFFSYNNLLGIENQLVLQLGHSNAVLSVAFSKDGTQILSGSADNTLKLWDKETGKLIHTFIGHTSPVYTFTFSPDGKQILSGGEDRTLILWNKETGGIIRIFRGHKSSVLSLSFSNKGQQILSGSSDFTIRLWDKKKDDSIRVFNKQSGLIKELVFNPNNHEQFLSVSEDKKEKHWSLQLWNRKGELLKKYEAIPISEFSAITLSPNIEQILIGDKDNVLKLWDKNSGQLIRKFVGHSSSIHAIDFSPDGSQILSGSVDETLKLWDKQTGKLLHSFEKHFSSVFSVSFSPDGSQILSGSGDSSIILWDKNTGKVLQHFEGNSLLAVRAVAMSPPDGSQILSGHKDNILRLWDKNNGKLDDSFVGHSKQINAVSFSPDGNKILSASDDNTVKLWDKETGILFHSFEDPSSDGGVRAIAFNSKGSQILSGNADSTIKLWDINKKKLIQSFEGHFTLFSLSSFTIDSISNLIKIKEEDKKVSYSVNAVAFNPKEEEQFLSGSDDKTLKLWNIKTDKVITFEGHSKAVKAVAFSPDGEQLLSGGADGHWILWNKNSKEKIHDIDAHTSSISSIVFSPDGIKILSGSHDNTLKLWNKETGEFIRAFSGHASDILSITFSPDGNEILSGSKDGTLKLWNQDGQELFNTISFSSGEWAVWNTKKLIYNSDDGDKFFSLRFKNDPSILYPLEWYRGELKKEQDFYNDLSAPMRNLRPKVEKHILEWLKIKWKGIVTVDILILFLIGILFFIRSRKKHHPMYVARNFFSQAGFSVKTTKGNFLFLRSKDNNLSSVSLWNPQESEKFNQKLQLLKDKYPEMTKLYLIYWEQHPSPLNFQKIQQYQKLVIVPLSAQQLEKAYRRRISGTELKKLETPYVNWTDPYFQSIPIYDSLWHYGRNTLLERLPPLLIQGQHVGIFGLRKIGKTSFVIQLQQTFLDHPTLLVDCQKFSESNQFESIFGEILENLREELKDLGIKKSFPFLGKMDSLTFRKYFLELYEKWKKRTGQTKPFLLIFDEIEHFFPEKERENREKKLSNYAILFRTLRSLAQEHQCLTIIVNSYRPEINRLNLLSKSIGENPMFQLFKEEMLRFLSKKENKKMIQEIGKWKDISWNESAIDKIFFYCGGHPYVTRIFASKACKAGEVTQISLDRVEETAKEVIDNIHKNEIGNYFREALWGEVMWKKEIEILQRICRAKEVFIKTDITIEEEKDLASLENFGLVRNENGRLTLSSYLYQKWLEREIKDGK